MDQPKTHDELVQALIDQTPKSGELWKSSQEVIPGGLLSLARKFKPYPFYTQRGQGAYIWDIDDNRYIDCCLSYGTLVLGHRPQAVLDALDEQEKKGTVYGAPHPMEILFAERFIECIPCAERVLICNTGTEATMQGIRIMRAYTGKDRIGKFESGYHGWHDYAMWNINVDPVKMGPDDKPNLVPASAGIPKAIEDTLLLLPYGESAFDMIEEHASELAGVMIEPVFGTGAMARNKEFLQGLREVTKRTGVPLMFDEVVTGFRLALGGAQEVHGVLPDLATYGKIIGGGLPIGAVACSNEYMDAILNADLSISISGTFSGNPLTLAAGHAMLGYLMDNQQIYGEMEAKGDRLRNGFNEFAQAKGLPAVMTGTASIFYTHLKEPPILKPRDMLGQHHEALEDLQLYFRLNGVFVPWVHIGFISAEHTDEDIEEILRVHQVSVEASLKSHGVI
jgi:glutamate-1-semialdehyde 2,1-aminomutase